MPKRAKELTAAAVAKLRTPGRYPVGGAEGLHLRITEAGSRLWVCRIIVGDKRRDIGLGRYEDVSLSQARDEARDKRKMVRQGVNPMPTAKEAPPKPKTPHPFRKVAAEFIAGKKEGWKNEKHKAQWSSTLETYVYPFIGDMDVADVAMANVLDVLRPIWSAKTETATRVRGRVESVLAYAAVQGWRDTDNPARWKGLLDKVLPEPEKIKKTEHHPAMPIDEAPAFMDVLAGVKGTAAMALRLLVLTATRSGEVRGARWSEFDLEEGVWTIPADRMKGGVEHRVPLSTQALRLLSVVPKFKDNELLFPSAKGELLSDMAMTVLMRKRGLVYVPHGFRSTFRDWAGDHTEYQRDIVEAALAHTVGNKVEAAYRRKDALERRRPLMQDWADHLLSIRRAASAPDQTAAKP